jgi:hypothetical protein
MSGDTTPTEEQVLDNLLDAALEISARWGKTLCRLKEALECGDDKQALLLAKELCSIDDEARKAPIKQPAKAKKK